MANLSPQSRFVPMVGVELTDGRVLDKSFREFLPGYAGHVLRFARQDGGLRFVLRFDHQARDERAAMVCDHFARGGVASASSRRTSNSCARMSPAPAIGRWRWSWRPVLSPRGRRLGIGCTASAPIWTTRRRHVLSAETGASSSPKTMQNMNTKHPNVGRAIRTLTASKSNCRLNGVCCCRLTSSLSPN